MEPRFRISLVARVTARNLHNNMLGVYRRLVSGHEISRLQHFRHNGRDRSVKVGHEITCYITLWWTLETFGDSLYQKLYDIGSYLVVI